MVDERARYFRTLRKLRRSTRRWSVTAATLAGATAVLVPYHGVGLPDAIWAAFAGASAMVTAWRWRDHRALAAQPAPPEPDPTVVAARAQRRFEGVVARLAGPNAVEELRRAQGRLKMRGLAVSSYWARLDRASATLSGLASRLTGPAQAAVLEAGVAERSLRELGERVASVERAMRVAPKDAAAELSQSHQELVGQFAAGVESYERLVAAAAGYVAEDGRLSSDPIPMTRLVEATELLRGITAGLSELRVATRPTVP
ncbi:MAG TPA: hypothetical protein VF054_10850 [Micromonosporaceae bacterium]